MRVAPRRGNRSRLRADFSASRARRIIAPRGRSSDRFGLDDRGVSETIGNVLLIVMAVAMLGAFGALVISSVTSDTPTPPVGTFTMEPRAGEAFVNVRHVSGSYLDLASTQIFLQSNATSILGSTSLVDGSDAAQWAPGETLRINLSSGTLAPSARLFLMVVDDGTGKSIGTAWATVPSSLSGTTILQNQLSATLSFDRSPLTADGRTSVNATVRVASDLGILLIDSVLLNLSTVGGDPAVPMYDNGIAPDPVGNDGDFTARFSVDNFTFTSLPGFSNQTITADVMDVIGRSASATSLLYLTSAPVSKVGYGTEFRNIGSSGLISTTGFLNLTGFTFRDASAVDDDQIEVRVADLADPTKAWSALVSFDDDACPSPSVTSVVLRRDGVAGNVTYTPTGGCFPVDVDSRLNLANIHGSLNASLATTTWTPVGTEATFQYAAAGIGSSNEALIAYFGDITTTAPLATGLGQADLTWAPLGAAATAPSAITTLAGTPGNGYVDLAWTAPSNGGSPITGYQIFRDGVLIDTIGTNTTYRAAGLTNGQSYTFVVRAVNAVGASPDSNSVVATPAALPGVPQSFTAQAAIGRVYLNWSAPASNGGFPITAYRIYLNGTLHATIGTNTSFVALGLQHNSTYNWEVSAVTSQGEGPKTTSTAATTPGVPYPPSGLTLTPGDGSISFSWTAPTNDGGRPIAAYKIYRNGTLVDTIGTNTSYVLGGLVNGVSYTIGVSAVNEVGDGNAASASATPAPGATVPGVPTSFTVAATNGTAFVNWSAPASDGGSAITNYRVYRNGTLLQQIGTNTTYIAAGLANGVAYEFNVSAVNAVGEGARTTTISVTPAGIPYPPSLTGAVAGNRSVALAWTIPYDGGSAISAFKVYNASSGGLIATTASGANTSFTVNGLTNGTAYSFRLTAVNAIGESAVSNTLGATPVGAPFPPTSLAASASNASVALSWTIPYNSGSALTGFRIVNASNGATIATTSNGANTTFTVNSLTNGFAYTFYVAALNAAGASSGSNLASATPTSVPFPPSGLAATNSSTGVALSWSAPSSDGGSAITGYNVYRNGTLLASIGTNTSFTDTTGIENVAYTYTVRAVNAVGTSSASNAVSGSRPVTAFAIDCGTLVVASGTISACSAIQTADSTFGELQEPAQGSSKIFNATVNITVSGAAGTHTLEMKGYQSQGNENLGVYAWNFTSNSYQLIATLDSSSSASNVVTFSGNVTSTIHYPSGTLRILLADAGPDPNRSSWQLDYVRMVL